MAAEQRRNIVVTWPQTKPLDSYLAELARAARERWTINYRVARLPAWPDTIEDHGWTGWPYGVETPRCFMVHTGYVRGWCAVIGAGHRADGEVEGWPSGLYVVRDPEWHPLAEPIPMPGFQGWRWTDVRAG